MSNAQDRFRQVLALIQSGKLTTSEVDREISGATRLLHKDFRRKQDRKMVDALCTAMDTPDVEVRVTFDSHTECQAAVTFISEIIVAHNAGPLVDWDKSKGDTLELKNGSGLKFISPEGEGVCLKLKR